MNVHGGRLRFAFRGKSGQPREVVVDDRRLAGIVKRLQDLPGQSLFQYLDDEGKRHTISSSDVNDYLRDAQSGSDEDEEDATPVVQLHPGGKRAA